MPATITLDDVAAMAGLDEHHRYELSWAGVSSVMPPATPEHALTVARIAHKAIKRDEYAAAGIPRCWIVERDKANTVQALVLRDGVFVTGHEPRSLAWLVNGPVPELS